MGPYLICFGDSLTAGFQSGGFGEGSGSDTPYGAFLQSWLGSRGTVSVSGICGEVTQEMTQRFGRDVVRHHPDTVIILGGTNDLGCGLSPGSIMKNLQMLYRQAQDAGILAMGVTVPSIGMAREESMRPDPESEVVTRPIPEWVRSHIDSRRSLNRMIRNVCTEMQMPCVDLFDETSEGPHGLLIPDFSNDGLHLSTRGYERFAELVWRVLFAERFGVHKQGRSIE